MGANKSGAPRLKKKFKDIASGEAFSISGDYYGDLYIKLQENYNEFYNKDGAPVINDNVFNLHLSSTKYFDDDVECVMHILVANINPVYVE